MDEFAGYHVRNFTKKPKADHFVLQSNTNADFWISFAFAKEEPRLPSEWTSRVTNEKKNTWDSAVVFAVTQTVWCEYDNKFFPLEVRQFENRGDVEAVPTLDKTSEINRFYWLDCDKMEEILTPKGIVTYRKTAPPSADLFSDLKQYVLDVKKIP